MSYLSPRRRPSLPVPRSLLSFARGEISKNDTQYDDLTQFDTRFICLSKIDTGGANSFKRRDSPMFYPSTTCGRTSIPPFFYPRLFFVLFFFTTDGLRRAPRDAPPPLAGPRPLPHHPLSPQRHCAGRTSYAAGWPGVTTRPGQYCTITSIHFGH
jgi:hypothetical protein